MASGYKCVHGFQLNILNGLLHRSEFDSSKLTATDANGFTLIAIWTYLNMAIHVKLRQNLFDLSKEHINLTHYFA